MISSNLNRPILGFDIGGTKCAVILGMTTEDGGSIRIEERIAIPSVGTPETIQGELERIARQLIDPRNSRPDAIGISCGGPLNSRLGVIQGPPNLPEWRDIAITDRFSRVFGCPAHLQNDANACAVAEWRWGAGRGTRNMVFLTFGTGMGAGLIIDGNLYSGTSDNAGEVGHMRLAKDGPEGYGKQGSLEGFCSGGGILRLARMSGFEGNNAREVFIAAKAGNRVAAKVVWECAQHLGRGLAVVVDILNPERIVIGGIFARNHEMLWPIAAEELDIEALPASVAACRVVPAQLGEQIGDYAALSVATLAFKRHHRPMYAESDGVVIRNVCKNLVIPSA
jgi:glucokinase